MNEAVDPAIVAVRALVYIAALVAFGERTYAALRVGGGWPLAARLAAPLTLLAGALVYLALLAREIGDGSLDLGLIDQLIQGTGFGRALAASAGLSALTAAMAPLRRPGPSLAASGGALAALAFVGHSADGEGAAGLLRIALMALHLLAAGAWLGALPPLMMALGRRSVELTATLAAFARLGAAAVATVLVTGLASLAYVFVGAHGQIAAAYGETLAVKLACVAGLLALAALNRWRLTPLATRDPVRAAAWLRRTVLAEQALGLGAIAAVALLGQLDPGM